MKRRLFSAILICFVMPVRFLAQEYSSSMNPQRENLTQDSAVAAIRSKAPNSATSFQVVRAIQSSAETRELAQRSLQESLSRHGSLYGDGVFLDVLKSGGFLILESDSNSGKAVSINLVSSETGGRTVIESNEIQGSMDSAMAMELMAENADFVNALLDVSSSSASTLVSRFYGGQFPNSDGPSDEGLFEVPRSVSSIKAVGGEYQELAALSGVFHFWPIRYAISLPIYPANPSSALSLARQKYQALIEEFRQRNNKSTDFIYDLEDLESIRDADQLRERISWFRRIDDFLEQAANSARVPADLKINRAISTICLQLGSISIPHRDEHSFLVVTSPGLIVEWKRPTKGTLAVTKISLAEDSDSGNVAAESQNPSPSN